MIPFKTISTELVLTICTPIKIKMQKNSKSGMAILKRILLMGWVTFFANSIFAQTTADSLLNTYGEKFPQEKIYLHYDKNYYNAGETIWFKAYLTTDNLPSTISKTLYAELIDDKGAVLQKKIMPVYESGAAANFDLPDTITKTHLFIRAYTSWMLNFDSSLLYINPIQIIPAKNNIKKIVAPPNYSLTFFPEGGDMVENISCRIAFKATDENGVPINVSGNIINAAGKVITSFSSMHDGMGYFFISPEANENYKAIWKDKKNTPHQTLLPKAKNQGIVLSINNKNDSLKYSLQRSDSADEALTSLTVIAQMQQQVVYVAKINLSKKTGVTAPINTENFSDGIMQLTVFNAAKIPVAQRLVFINHNTYSFITDLHAVEKNLTKHGHNTLQIDVGDTILSNLSIAVTDADINPTGNTEQNIFSHLLLTSDLKGYVYNPSYYFNTEGDSVKQHVDLVMMTNGWRRFKWENVLARQWPKITHPIDNYLSVTGSILGVSRVQLAGKDLTGIIKTKNKTSDFISIPVNSNGQFRLTGMYFFDTAKLFYQINGDKDKTLTSSASFIFKNEMANAALANTNLLSSFFFNVKTDSATLQKNLKLASLQHSLFDINKSKTLDAVIVRAKVKSLAQKLDEQYTSGFFAGGDGYTFAVENDPLAQGGGSVLDYLKGKVAGLQINPDGSGASWRGSTPSLFLNETTTDFNLLQNMTMNDVALIKVFRPPFFGATGGGAGGAIAIYTKKGGGDNSAIKGLEFTNLYGYTSIKEFYMPDYEKTNTDTPDYRTTLYWNPFLIMDRITRRIKVPFYNTDNCKRIRVVIEGINRLGQFTREEKFFE